VSDAPARQRVRTVVYGLLALVAVLVPIGIATVGVAAIPAVAAQAAERPGPVVLIGVDTLDWPTTSELPAVADRPLRELATGGSVGSVSVRTGQSPTCPLDGWLTVSAGRRAVGVAPGPRGQCVNPLSVQVDPTSVSAVPLTGAGRPDPRHAGQIPGWDQLAAVNAASGYAARIGSLGAAVAAARSCITAAGPNAPLAAADPSGRVDAWVADPLALTPEILTGCPISIVDAGANPVQAAQVIARVQRLLPADGTLLVVGVDDVVSGAHLPSAVGSAGDRPTVGLSGISGLRVAGASGHRFPGPPVGGLLTSDATRWPGMVTLTDVTPTVLAAAGIAVPAGLVGSVWRAVPGPAAAVAVDGLRVDALRARVAQDTVPRFYTGFGIAAGLVLIVALLTGRWAPRWRSGSVLRAAGLVVAAAPVATRFASLVPWWRAGSPELALPGAVLAAAIVVAGVAWALARGAGRVSARRVSARRYRPGTDAGGGPTRTWQLAALVVACVTTLTVAVDLLAGSPLQRLTVIGLTPIQGGRFYGMGNEIFAATAICALVVAAGWAAWRPDRAVGGCIGIGVVFVLLDGLPSVGADFGGVPAAVAGFAVAALALRPGRLRLRWVLLSLAAALVVLGGFVALDLSRPPGSRTHVGTFAADLLSGSTDGVVGRKVAAAAGPLLFRIGNAGASAFAWFGVGVVLVVAVVLVRPRLIRHTALGRLLRSEWPQLHAVLVGAVVLGVLGGLLNDSGVAVPLIMCEVGVGLVVAALPVAGVDDPPTAGVAALPAGVAAGTPRPAFGSEHLPTDPDDDWEMC